jgi:Fic family protein
MRKFDYSFLESGMIPAGLVNLVSSIAGIREHQTANRRLYPEAFTRLEDRAKIDSVKGSNEIEGIVTSAERLHAIVTQNSPPRTHNEMEIAGYRDALALIHTEFQTLAMSERTLLRLHAIMLSHTGVSGGSYKQSDNVIVEINAFGERRIRFAPVPTWVPTPAADTAKAMEQLMLAYIDAQGKYGIHPLLLIPCFVLDFLCVHPFMDGNGRISRLLSLLLLYTSGYDAGKYISFEEQINKTKSEYYQALKLSSDHWHDAKNTYFPFMENFLFALFVCYSELDKRFAGETHRKATKRRRIEAILQDSLRPASKQEICDLLPDVSPTTVEATLADLLKNEVIKKLGAGRATRYIQKI